MDELTLVTLSGELKADCQVAQQAWQLAQARFGEEAPSAMEAVRITLPAYTTSSNKWPSESPAISKTK